MNTKSGLLILSSGLVIASLGCAAQPQESQEDPGTQSSAVEAQSKLAASTMKLENAFSNQFIKGKIDREALKGAIDDVVQAMPEEARPKVQQHIDKVIESGIKAVSQMTPEQRSEVASAPPIDKVDKTAQAQIAAWGWGPGIGLAGWGGIGAFGFPGMFFGFGAPFGFGGYGLGYGLGYGASYASSYGIGYGAIGLGGCGFGLGCGGWYW